jgi:hypothetical protein
MEHGSVTASGMVSFAIEFAALSTRYQKKMVEIGPTGRCAWTMQNNVGDGISTLASVQVHKERLFFATVV